MGWADPENIRRNNFDFLRFALATAVIASHSFALLGFSEPFATLSRGQIDLGKIAVDCFFVISGFLISHSWMRCKTAAEYYKKRVFRIYPAFAVAILFGAFIVAPLSLHSLTGIYSQSELLSIVKGILILRGHKYHGLFPNNPSHALNGAIWSISFEFWCYIGVSFCAVVGLLKRPKALLVIFAIFLAVSVVFLLYKLNPGGKILGVILGSPREWARMLPYYLSGMLFYLFRHQIRYSKWLALECAIILAIFGRIPNGIAIAMPTCGTYLLFWFAFHPDIRLDNWAKYGDFSYGMYLYAFPLQQLVVQWKGPSISPLALFTYAFVLSLFAGIASWYWVEKWFLRAARKRQASPAVLEVAAPVPA